LTLGFGCEIEGGTSTWFCVVMVWWKESPAVRRLVNNIEMIKVEDLVIVCQISEDNV